MFAVTVGFIAFCLNGQLSNWQGAIMILLLCSYLTWSYFSGKSNDDSTAGGIVDEIEGVSFRPHSILGSLGFLGAGIALLVVGAELLIQGGIDIAFAAGVSEATIGITLIALGTSLPELATSIVAAIRRHGDVAIGNVIGSNLFNILGVMGVTSVVRTVPISEQIVSYELWIMLSAAILATPFILFGRPISRRYGVFLTTLYLLFVLSLLYLMPKTNTPQSSQPTTEKHNVRILPTKRQLANSIDHQFFTNCS